MPPVLRVELKVNGATRVLSQLQPILFSMDQRINAIPQATVLLSSSGNAVHHVGREAEAAWCRPGAEVSVYFDDQQVRQAQAVFTGVVVEQSLELRWDAAVLTLRLRHALARLESSCRSAVYADMSAADIVTQLLRAQQVSCRNTAGMAALLEQTVQFQCSDWRFVRSLLDANNAWLLPGPQDVDILLPRLSDRPDHIVDSNAGQAPVFEGAWSFNAQYQPAEVRTVAWNIDQQESVTATAGPVSLGAKAFNPVAVKALNSQPWVLGRSSTLAPQTLEAWADALRSRLGLAAVRGDFQLQGSARYRLGQTLALTGFGECFDGSGIITGVRHHIDKSRWVTTVSLGLAGVQTELTPPPSIEGLHVGVVAAFEPDPRGQERLRVALPILGHQVVWARLALPHASKGSGFHFYPEPGDEVVVGFFDGRPSDPVLLGAMHNPVNKPPVPLSKGNQFKGFTLRQDDKELALMLGFDGDAAVATLKAHEDSLTLKEGWLAESATAVTLKAPDDSLVMRDGISAESRSRIALQADSDRLEMKKGVVIDSRSGPAEVQVKGKQIKLINT